MPKRVDHEQRRREITAALWRIASTSGLEAVSLAQVAAEAGVSKGRVQHYFRSKEEMLTHATSLLRDRVGERIGRQLEDAPTPRTPRETLRAVLLALLPTDEDSRTEALVSNAFLIRAIQDETLAARFTDGQVELRNSLATLLAAGQEHGDIDPTADPEREADILLAVVGGIGDALLIGRHDAATATSTVDYQLARIAATAR